MFCIFLSELAADTIAISVAVVVAVIVVVGMMTHGNTTEGQTNMTSSN